VYKLQFFYIYISIPYS